jgi:predicted O-methyltransferase YrrM
VNLGELLSSLSAVNLKTVTLAARKPNQLRNYVGYCLKRYEELAETGLRTGAPVVPSLQETIALPAAHTGGGMSFTELVILARTIKTRKPKAIFEMGSYDGLATAVFLLNAPAGAKIYSLDLPPNSGGDADGLDSDKDLIEHRKLGEVPRALGLNNYTQLLCDSMVFDPTPYADSIEFGLVDAAHDVEHARNDTIKMVQMLAPNGILFWHDYGGKGAMRPLAKYIESIGRQCELRRVPETSLAWGFAKHLRTAKL